MEASTKKITSRSSILEKKSRESGPFPYKTQKKEVSERNNYSILEAARAMLHHQDMPRYLWVEACSTITYIQNIVLHKVLGRMTPKEYFIRKMLDVRHFKIFRSLANCHIPGDTHTKLDQIVERGALLGIVKPQRHISFLSLAPKELFSYVCRTRKWANV